MNETITEERRPVPGFSDSYLIPRNGTIYSPQGRELFRTDDVESSKVELRLPGDEIGKFYDLARLIKRAIACVRAGPHFTVV